MKLEILIPESISVFFIPDVKWGLVFLRESQVETFFFFFPNAVDSFCRPTVPENLSLSEQRIRKMSCKNYRGINEIWKILQATIKKK